MTPDVVVYVCCNCIPQGKRLPRQWTQQGAHVLVREVPCSGKMDAQYLMHAIEGGVRGLCVVACPKGECHLAQGNIRRRYASEPLGGSWQRSVWNPGAPSCSTSAIPTWKVNSKP